jgi:phosphatidylinositol glycan class Q protein
MLQGKIKFFVEPMGDFFAWMMFRLFNWQIRLLIILFRLFCGKKQNPLRNNRLDSHLCDIDQLFIVTLTFTILLFLLPSIFMYYAVFTSVRKTLF